MLEAYSVAVKVSLINGVTSGLMTLSRQFAKVHGDAFALQKQLDRIKLTALAGGAIGGVGFMGLKLLQTTLPAAKEYGRQMALMNTLGLKQADVARAAGAAWKAAYAVPTTTAAGNLGAFRELRSAFGSDSQAQEHASTMLPVVGRIQGILQSLTGKPQERVGFDMVKAIELRTGVMTTEALKRNSDLMAQALLAMGGTLNVSDFHATLKRGGIATNKWSDDFVYRYLPTLMQEFKTSGSSGGGGGGGGAQSAGTALMSLYQQMHGRMTKAAMPLWVQSGLVKQSDVVKNAGGQYQVKPGAVKGTSLFETNPYLWVQQFLGPAVQKLMAARHISAESAINAMFSNRNAANAAYNMFFKSQQYERDKQTIGKADTPYAAYQKLLKTDPTMASQALHSQWQNILAQIGYSIMPTLIRGTLAFVKVLDGLSAWMRKHPKQLKLVVAGFAALSTALTALGVAAVVGAGLSALATLLPAVGIAFGAVGVAVGVLLSPLSLTIAAIIAAGIALTWVATHWDTVKTAVGSAFDWIKGKIANGWGAVKSAIGGFFSWLWDKVKWLGNLLPHIGAPVTPRSVTNGASHGSVPPAGYQGLFGSPFTPRGPPNQGPLTGDVNMDGRKVGSVVWKHVNDAMGSPGAVGIGGFDPNISLAPAGLAYR